MNQSYYQECQYYHFEKQQNAQINNIKAKVKFNIFVFYQKVHIFIEQLCQSAFYYWSKID